MPTPRFTTPATLTLCALLVGCTPDLPPAPTEVHSAPVGVPSESVTPTSVVDATPSENADTQLSADLQRIADEAANMYGGAATVAVSDGTQTFASAEAGPYVAWSTSKVPIAIAALRVDPGLAPIAEAAITVSDNVAAESLWAAVTPAQVEAVLAEAGTPIAMNTVITRPGFTAFGQTQFSTHDQATFAAGLPCVAGSGDVLAMMGRISPDQAYGLGTMPGAQFKGGWGPDTAGRYVIRQLGLVDGRGVALTVAPADGQYATGQQMATQIAGQLGQVLQQMPKAACTN